ncbi:MAG: ribonuclease H-like domain-containing protein [Acidobacteria bacterium]|nr:ribonuclease H-like domain-containing protein [Acidobacteriota bacterium]
MDDLRAQLALLKQRLDRQRSAPVEEEFIEDPLPGEEVSSPLGTHWEAFTHWDNLRRHGSFEISTLSEVAQPNWAFLDTETTGLAGGAGTLAFLVGVGRLTSRGFTVKQYFSRDFDEEASVLHTLAEDLRDVDTLVTYNGKSFDVPLLETRYTLARQRAPFARMEHLDLLYDARRRWKLRYDSCRLVELETQVFGLERQGDVPGSLIPQLYFEFLRTRQPHRLVPVFRHNALDIVSLACLSVVVPRTELTHAAEMVGIARWLKKQGQAAEAIELLERAHSRPGEFMHLPAARQYEALVELAKHYERTRKEPARALEFAIEARLMNGCDEARRREERLRRKATAPLLQSPRPPAE